MAHTATKSDSLVNLLRRRIREGDYVQRPLPTETALAREVGVSRMTARKALMSLVEAGP